MGAKVIAKGVRVVATLEDGTKVAGVTERRTTAIMSNVLVRIDGRFMPLGIPRDRVQIIVADK